MEVRTESEVTSSIRSTISTASSGYAIVSARGKPRKPLSDNTPYYEPPPDYDQPAVFAERSVPSMTQQPLLPQQLPSPASSQHPVSESQQPLLHDTSLSSNDGKKMETRVRLNSAQQNITIEVTQHGLSTPTLSNTSFSPSSTSNDVRHFFPAKKGSGGRKKNCYCQCCVPTTRKEKCLCGFLIAMTIALVVAGVVIVIFVINSSSKS